MEKKTTKNLAEARRIVKFVEEGLKIKKEYIPAHLTSVKKEEDRQLLTAVMIHDQLLLRNALNSNADVNVTNDELKTSLHLISEDGNTVMAEEILTNKKVKLNVFDMYGTTPLFLAVVFNNVKMAHLLLHHGAEPNKVCRHGEIALHAAISAENYKMTELLLQYGTKVNLKNCFGESPLKKAVELSNEALVQLLFLHGATCENIEESYSVLSHLVLAAKRPQYRLIQIVLLNGAYINSFNKYNKLTILHLAAMRGVDFITAVAIRNGANLYAVDTANNIPLHTATHFKNWSTARIIIEAMEEAEFEDTSISKKSEPKNSTNLPKDYNIFGRTPSIHPRA